MAKITKTRGTVIAEGHLSTGYSTDGERLSEFKMSVMATKVTPTGQARYFHVQLDPIEAERTAVYFARALTSDVKNNHLWVTNKRSAAACLRALADRIETEGEA